MCDLQALLNRIKEEKKRNNITTDILSERANVPKSTLSKILSGAIKEPTLTSIIKIANALNVTTDYLVYGKSVQKSYFVSNKYNMLNAIGKAKADAYIDGLAENPEYINTKPTLADYGEIAAEGGELTTSRKIKRPQTTL